MENTVSMERRLKKLRDEPKCREQGLKPKIQKVPFMLCAHRNFDKYYAPRAIAIGPFHHGRPRYEWAEEIKLMLTSTFIKYTGQKDEGLYKKIEENIKDLRDCYTKEAAAVYNDEELAWMLFLDGCSTLQIIYTFMHPVIHAELETKFKIKRDQIAIAQQDLFLLENQVPYKVLKLLMSSSHKYEEFKNSIYDFVQLHIIIATDKQSKGQEQQPSVIITLEEEPTHLLDLFRTRMLGPPRDDIPKKGVKYFSGQSVRNVQELDAAGINFEPSESNSLRDITFASGCLEGYLCLPAISVDDSTGPKFMNLIAYEMCPDFQNDYEVTSYIAFLDALIHNANDVMKLRAAGVLHNLLRSDKEVAQLFNEIGTDLVPNTAISSGVKAAIEKHYKTKWRSLMSQFWQNHCNSPWTVLATLGVLSALMLSGIQTWYTVYS